MATEEAVKKATAGFIVSLIAGIFILINGLMWVVLAEFVEDLGASFPVFATDIFTGIFSGLAAVGIIFALVVIIGAILIYMPGKEVIGSILVLIFSILSIVIGGGFLIGLILGIIGGVLGLVKK